MISDILHPLLVAIFVAANASLLGTFAILKRMALVGDALTHVALPGMALGLIFNFSPFWGALVFLMAATFGIWFLEQYSELSVETLVGIFFSASLAVGVLLTPDTELLEALFGNITELGWIESLISIALSLFIMILVFSIRRKLALNMLSPELAQSIGINNRKLELVYLLLFALAVALGIRFVGVLLMGSLVIILAAAAKNIAHGFKSFLSLAMIFGVISSAMSIFVWKATAFEPGPVFIIVSSAIFIFTLIWRLLRK